MNKEQCDELITAINAEYFKNPLGKKATSVKIILEQLTEFAESLTQYADSTFEIIIDDNKYLKQRMQNK